MDRDTHSPPMPPSFTHSKGCLLCFLLCDQLLAVATVGRHREEQARGMSSPFNVSQFP